LKRTDSLKQIPNDQEKEDRCDASYHLDQHSNQESDIRALWSTANGCSFAGTTGFDYETMTISNDVVEQAEQCLQNIEAALAEAGSGISEVVRVRYILPGTEDFESCWPVLRSRFRDVRPAASMIAAGLSDCRMKIEIEVTARQNSVE
jgi:enamine deaminase RidA (YjgF/YER057c/UK114 family)